MSYTIGTIAVVVIIVVLLSTVAGTVEALHGLGLAIQYALVFTAGVSLKTTLHSLSIILVALLSIFLLYQLGHPLYGEAAHVQKFIQERHKTVGSLRDRAAYIRIRRHLTEPFELRSDDRNILLKWLKKYRVIFHDLPKKHAIQTIDNTMGFHKRTQFKLLRLSHLKRSVLFILHEEMAADANVEIITSDSMPTVEDVMEFVANSISRDHIAVCLENLQKGVKEGFTGEPHSSRWAYLYLPDPLSEFDFTGMLRTYLKLDGLI
jgi:hypothetical protein